MTKEPDRVRLKEQSVHHAPMRSGRPHPPSHLAILFLPAIVWTLTGFLVWCFCFYLLAAHTRHFTGQPGRPVILGEFIFGLPFAVIGSTVGALRGSHLARRHPKYRTVAAAIGNALGLTTALGVNLVFHSIFGPYIGYIIVGGILSLGY